MEERTILQKGKESNDITTVKLCDYGCGQWFYE